MLARVVPAPWHQLACVVSRAHVASTVSPLPKQAAHLKLRRKVEKAFIKRNIMALSEYVQKCCRNAELEARFKLKATDDTHFNRQPTDTN